MSGGTTFNTDFATLTVDNYIRESVTDNIFDDHVLLNWVETKVGFDRVSGGDNILVPVGTAEDSNGGSYSGYDTFDTDPSETLTNAVYTWKSYQQPIVAQAREVLRNQTEEGVANLWMEKSEVALRSLRSKLNANAFADGTGNSGKNILGLAILVDSTGTVGNIARASNAWWAGQETASGGTLAVDGSTGMLQVFNDCSTSSMDSSTPQALMTTQAVWQFYHALLAPDIRYVAQSTGDGTFSNMGFRGKPVMFDADCTAETIYFLNPSSFEAYIHPARDFMTTEVAKADNGTLNQDAWIAHILVWPELVVAEGRRNGKLTGVTS